MNWDKLLAFHSSQEIKDFFVKRLIAHKEAGEIKPIREPSRVMGHWAIGLSGWIAPRDIFNGGPNEEGGWSGDVSGCLLHSSDKSRCEKELGIPVSLMRALDLFSGIVSKRDAPTLAVQALETIQPGADLRDVVIGLVAELVRALDNDYHGRNITALKLVNKNILSPWVEDDERDLDEALSTRSFLEVTARCEEVDTHLLTMLDMVTFAYLVMDDYIALRTVVEFWVECNADKPHLKEFRRLYTRFFLSSLRDAPIARGRGCEPPRPTTPFIGENV